MSRRLVRKIRSIGNSQTEILIKNATSNDPFGPTTTQLNQLALLTQHDKPLSEIITVLTKRLNDGSRDWRHVLKSLTVILYCLLTGSTDFLHWARKNSYMVSTLKEFDLKGSDNIAHQIRQKSKSISKLLNDEALLEDKRANFHTFRNSMSRPSVDQRSSLDVSRHNHIDLETMEVPLSAKLDLLTKSMELARPSDHRKDEEEQNALDNIAEE